MSRNLVYCDVETTGLDEKSGHLLEVALLAVSLPTFEPVARFTNVVLPPCWETVKRNMNEKVRAMHDASGLIAMLDAAATTGSDNSVAQVELRASAFIQHWAPRTQSWHTPMAGANPSFDRKWLEKHMPHLAKKFHYRHFEVRTITFLQEWILGEAFVESPHRALADCEQANNTVRAFLGLT